MRTAICTGSGKRSSKNTLTRLPHKKNRHRGRHSMCFRGVSAYDISAYAFSAYAFSVYDVCVYDVCVYDVSAYYDGRLPISAKRDE